jgi:hypothetical protein
MCHNAHIVDIGAKCYDMIGWILGSKGDMDAKCHVLIGNFQWSCRC